MAQFYSELEVAAATFAQNVGFDSLAGETTALEDIPCMGLRNLAVTIVCNSGNMSACALYGSPDGINYKAIAGLATFALAAGNMDHKEAVATYRFLRLTTTGVANLNVYLYATQ